MSIFVVVTSKQCPACMAIKIPDKTGVSFLNKIKDWARPYVHDMVEITMENNGDGKALFEQHGGFKALMGDGMHLPSFLIVSMEIWKDKTKPLHTDMFYRGKRLQKDFVKWAKEQTKKNHSTRRRSPSPEGNQSSPPELLSARQTNSRFFSYDEPEVQVERRVVEVPPRPVPVERSRVKIISLYE